MTIQEWLNNPSDFETGRKLYDKWGKNGHLKKQFASGRLREKLIYELSKLVGVDGDHSEDLIIITPEKPIFHPLPVADDTIKVSTPIEEEEDPRLKPLYRKRSLLHSQLMYVEKEQRLKNAEEIEKLTDEIESILFAKKVIEKVEAPMAILSDIEKLKRIQTLKTYLSRAEKRQTDPEKVTGWKEEKERLEKELNNEKTQ